MEKQKNFGKTNSFFEIYNNCFFVLDFENKIIGLEEEVEKIFFDREVASFGEAGELLDSELHDALMVRQEKDKNDNEIIEVFEKGYKYRDRVIRHAKVVVNKT